MSPVEILAPRWYQAEAIEKCEAAWVSGGLGRIAIDHATGLGKTVVISHLTKRYVASHSKRVAVFVHLDSLVKQTLKKIHSIAPNLTTGVVKAKRNELDADVVVISIQTITRPNRLHAIPADYFGLIVVDECHHAAADGYRRALEYFGCLPEDGSQGTWCLGVSATMGRSDKRGLGDIFQAVVDKRDILFGIRNGHLVEPRGKTVHLDALDLGSVPRSGGDFTQEKLGKEYERAHFPEAMAKAAHAEGADRQGVFFWPSIATAEQFRDECLKLGMPTEVVFGTTDEDERDAIESRIATGQTQILSNVSVAVEGWDMPQLSMVGVGACTNKYRLIQEVGRGLRPNPLHDPESSYLWMRKPKTDCLVLLASGVDNPNLVSLADLSETTAGVEVREGEGLTEAIDREETSRTGRVSVRTEDIDLFAKSSSAWFKTRKGYPFLVTEDWLVAMYPEDITLETYMIGKVWNNPRKPRQKGGTLLRGQNLGYGMAMAESIALELDPKLTLRSKEASWKKRKKLPPTDAQLAECKRDSIVVPEGATKVELSDHMTRIKGSRKLDGYSPKTRLDRMKERAGRGA
jgi:superfamily II DNA or RNA helicase